MPGKEIAVSPGPAASPDLSLFKAHKALPKRRAFSSDIGAASAATSKARKYDLEREGYSSSERIRSWIPKPSSTPTIPDHSLPLTPPLNASTTMNGLGHTGSPPNGASAPYALSHTASSGITTPVLKRSPPTPEITPPKLQQHSQISRESPNPHLPSTRAESFETARENLTTDDDSSQPESPSNRPSQRKSLPNAGHTTLKSIGLGLGLESEDGEQTPTGKAPKILPEEEEIVYFDGAWKGATPEMDAVRGGVDLAYRSELRKRLPKRPEISDQLLETPLINEQSSPPPGTCALTLRGRAENDRQTPPRASTEDCAEKIPWSLRNDSIDLEEKLREVDSKRLSQISTTSTTVEAVILSTPPRRRRTLRHSSKFTDLNSANIQSERKLSTANDHGHRRFPRHSKHPDGGQRTSFLSGSYGEDRTMSSRSKQDAEPVIVIPDRISALGSKPHLVLHLRRARTLTSARKQFSRPTTAPEDAVGYFDLPRPERRVVSAYVPTFALKEEKPHVKQAQQANATDNLLPSAKGDRNTSRAHSSGSIGKESISPPTRQQSQTSYRFPETVNTGLASPDEGSNGDWSALRPRSSLVGPFSLRSARSSTPGILEVNEATAISIYPHTNKSILVVQHAARRNSQPAEHSAIIASNAKFAIPAGSVQPPVIYEPRQLLNSPLQNPRWPPQPPGFKIIPPTPANMTDVSSPERRQRQPSEQTPKRRLSNRVKRAFSTRRYSDAFVTPLTRSFSLSRRNTVTGARRASTGIDPDRNLHPFWRPRAFWDKDDRSDSDSDFGNDGFLVGNSLGMPTEGFKTFDPPRRRGSLSQRFGSLRLPTRRKRTTAESVPPPPPPTTQNEDLYHYDGGEDDILPDPTPVRRSNSSRGGLGLRHRTAKFYRWGKGDNDSYEFIQPPHAQDHRGSNGVPRLGYQVQFVGFKGLAEKVKEKREEARREKVRERLRGSIDVLRGV